MSRALQGRLEKLEGRNGDPAHDDYFRAELRQANATAGANIDIDAIPAGKAGEVYVAAFGREVF